MTPIRVACFGAGWVTTHRHLPAMRADGRYEVVAIVDRDPQRAARAARDAQVPWSFGGTSVDDVPTLDRLGVRAIVCGTAPFDHHRVVSSALRSGRHAITEKPFAMTLDEGRELVELAASKGTQVAVVHNFQFARSVRQVDRWIRAGRLGRVHSLWATQWSNPRRRLPRWHDELPLGLFYDESPHLLYLLRHFAGGDLGPLRASIVPSADGGRRTPRQVTAQFDGPLSSTLAMNFEAPVSEWHLAVIGDEGAAMVDVFRDVAMLLPNDGGHRTLDVVRTSLAVTVQHWLGHLRSGPAHLRGRLPYGNEVVFARFADAVATGRTPAGISGADALAVLAIQHEIIAAATTEPVPNCSAVVCPPAPSRLAR